jgi:hypothetical protein
MPPRRSGERRQAAGGFKFVASTIHAFGGIVKHAGAVC